MSRLEELIQELCPDGVEYLRVSNVCNIIRGVQYNKRDMKETGSYPVINGGIEPSGYIENYNQKGNTITISQGGASAGYVNWISSKFWAGAHCYILHPSEKILNRYLYHYIKSKEVKLQECQYGAGIPALAKSTIEQIYIPVPPLEVQSEIVRILDNFTEFTAELTAELTARKQQYCFYLNFILDPTHNNWIKTSLNELADVRDGTHASPKASEVGYKLATSKNITSGNINLDSCYLIDEKDYNEINLRSKVDKYDVLFSMIGTVGEVAIVNEEPNFAIKNMGLIKTNGNYLLSKFIAYWIQSDYSINYIYKNLKGTAPRYLSLELLRNFPIYLPEESELAIIVQKLDAFHILCSDLNKGLPSEIAARQEQYEYYRDKLLTFKERTL